MDTGLSYQVLVAGSAKDRAGVQGGDVVSYHCGGKPGVYINNPTLFASRSTKDEQNATMKKTPQ